MIVTCDMCDESLFQTHDPQVLEALSEERFAPLCQSCYDTLMDKQAIADEEDQPSVQQRNDDSDSTADMNLQDALFVAQMDQQVSICREALNMMDQDDVIELFKDCGKGLVEDMVSGDDEENNKRLSLLIGRMAAIGIWKLLGKNAN